MDLGDRATGPQSNKAAPEDAALYIAIKLPLSAPT